jgi:pilus assembly protein Flp/PilA
MLFLPRDWGQGLVEYALILVLVAIGTIVVLGTLGGSVSHVFQQVVDELAQEPPPEQDCYGSLLLPYLVGATLLSTLMFRLIPKPPRTTE